MNLDELRTVQMKERKKDSLQHLRDSFYGDVATYIEDLKAQRSRAAEQADDPFSSPEVGRLTDEIETAEDVAEAVYERRVGKVVKLASFAAADMAVDEEGMTGEERRLFEDLVERIEQNKSTVLDTLAGKHDVPESDDSPESAVDATATDEPLSAAASPTDTNPDRTTSGPESPEADGNGMLADAMGSDPETGGDSGESADADSSDGRPIPPEEPPTETPASDGGTVTAASGDVDGTTGGPTPDTADETTTLGDDTERTTVRITRDVGEIFGVDEREYDLSTEDVVTLPSANADPLLQRDAAERID